MSIFETDGDTYIPTDAARGPWDPAFLHGGPVAILAGHAVEAVPSDQPMRTARITLELVRPVPVAPLTVEAALLRPGRKVRLVQASIAAQGREVARAVALQVRRGDLRVEASGADPPPEPHAESLQEWSEGWAGHGAYFHTLGVELRPLPGSDPRRPATVWVRLRTQPIAGCETTPLMRVLAAADFPNGVSLRADPQFYVSINPELTVHVQREPRGEWVCLKAETYLESDATGLAEGVLYDREGRVGRATQSLIIEPRA